jgi:hypothetical protein
MYTYGGATRISGITTGVIGEEVVRRGITDAPATVKLKPITSLAIEVYRQSSLKREVSEVTVTKLDKGSSKQVAIVSYQQILVNGIS